MAPIKVAIEWHGKITGLEIPQIAAHDRIIASGD